MSQLATTALAVNGKRHTVTALPDTPLLRTLVLAITLASGILAGCQTTGTFQSSPLSRHH